jgi:hypothetical protein
MVQLQLVDVETKKSVMTLSDPFDFELETYLKAVDDHFINGVRGAGGESPKGIINFEKGDKV